MSSVKANQIAALLRGQAESLKKSAASSTGAPSCADGIAQVTAGTVPTDPGEAELKAGMPTDGTPGDDTKDVVPGENLNPSGTPSADKGAPADIPKMASEKVAAVRNALLSTFPNLKSASAEPATADPATAPAATPVPDATQTAVEDPAKSAAVGELDLSPDMLIKLAKQILSTSEGVAYAQDTLEKAAGAEQASEMIKAAKAAADAHDETLYTKHAAFNEGMSKAAAIHADLSALITEADADEILKTAALHCDAIDQLEHPLLKAAYAEGMEDAAALEGGAEAGLEEPAMPGAGEQLSMEDVVALLQEMIASGEISEEDVIAGLQELQGAGPTAAAAPMEEPAAAAA